MDFNEALQNVSSDYLCLECKGLLYTSLSTGEEICANNSCSCFIKGTIFGSVNESKQLKAEVKSKKIELRSKLLKCHGPSLAFRLANMRNELVKDLFRGQGLDIEKFFVLNHILIELNTLRCEGHIVNLSNEEELIDEYLKYVSELNMIDSLDNKRYLIRMSDKDVFRIKYWEALFLVYQTMGITNKALAREDLFKYYHIDKHVKEYQPFNVGMELSEYFTQYFDFIQEIRYGLFMYYRTAQQFNYSVTTADIVAILGLIFSLPLGNNVCSSVKLIEHLNKNKQYGLDPYTFIDEYSISNFLAPIIIKSEENFICSRETMHFFLFHLIGLNDSNINRDKYHTIAQKKEQASTIFENYIRQLLKENGYLGPDEPFKLTKSSPEYDIFKISEVAQTIVLAEAKYRDFSPSSFSGETLIEQELLQEDKLLEHVIKQQTRLEYFQQNFNEFRNKFGIRRNMNEYNVFVCLVTKHIPLINAYKDVYVITPDDFKQLLKIS